MLGNLTQHAGANLFALMEGEFVVWPTPLAMTLWEPLWRMIRQPIRSRVARTRLALVAGQLVTEYLKRNAERGWWQFPVLNAVGDDLDRQLFGVADGFFPSGAVTHDSGQFHRFGNPPAIFLATEFNGENHRGSIHQFARSSDSYSRFRRRRAKLRLVVETAKTLWG